jgi:hypothetical protein
MPSKPAREIMPSMAELLVALGFTVRAFDSTDFAGRVAAVDQAERRWKAGVDQAERRWKDVRHLLRRKARRAAVEKPAARKRERGKQRDYDRARARGRGDPRFRLPEPERREGKVCFPLAERAGASPEQIESARLMAEHGMWLKANRRAHCGVVGGRLRVCDRNLQHRFFARYRCGTRYCPACSAAAFDKLFSRQMLRLKSVVEGLVPHWPCLRGRPERVIAKIDFTIRNVGQMPAPAEIRQFNKDIRRFWRAAERRFGIARDRYGYVWADEFGGRNSNLHAHGFYAGPWLPQKAKELSQLWAEIRGDRSFVSIKIAHSFAAGLAHALKYAGKFLSKDPGRLAQLEVAFHGVRRVHAVAAFYNPPTDPEPSAGSFEPSRCPFCDGCIVAVSAWRWRTVGELEAEGLCDLEQARRQIGRERAFGGPRGSPGGGMHHED